MRRTQTWIFSFNLYKSEKVTFENGPRKRTDTKGWTQVQFGTGKGGGDLSKGPFRGGRSAEESKHTRNIN